MLPAKMFAVFAVFFAMCAALARLTAFPPMDFAIHESFFAMGPALVFLFCAVTSINFVLLYYAAERIFHARWNRAMSILHAALFLCFGLSFSVVFAMSVRTANGGPSGEEMSWVVVPFFVGIFSLAASFVVFAANLTLTVVQIVRARFARATEA
jgi:hypothetical protein